MQNSSTTSGGSFGPLSPYINPYVSDLRQSRRLDEGGAAQSRMALRAKAPPFRFQNAIVASPWSFREPFDVSSVSNCFLIVHQVRASISTRSENDKPPIPPFPTFPEPSNSASPPAEPESFLLD